MTELGKVLQGLRACSHPSQFTEEDKEFFHDYCLRCPYCDTVKDDTRESGVRYLCFHGRLMLDALRLLTNYAKMEVRVKEEEERHRVEVDSWNACNYG